MLSYRPWILELLLPFRRRVKKSFSFRNIFLAPISHLHVETPFRIDDHVAHPLYLAEGLMATSPRFLIYGIFSTF